MHDTNAMLRGLNPLLQDENFVFCSTTNEALAEKARPSARGWFREAEGITLLLPAETAAQFGFDVAMPMRCIVLQVFSALDGVGLTAAVSAALAAAGIPCNVVAAYYHDHIFVPAAMASRAIAALRALQAAARG